MAKPTIRSSGRHDLILEQLLDVAEAKFARQGVAGTSLQELADAVGLTRTGIYHYVTGKDELLEHLVRGFTLETEATLTALAEDVERPVEERLREAVSSMAQRVAEHPRRFRLLLVTEDSLPENLAQQHRLARRATLSALSALIDQAKAAGVARSVDTNLAAFALFGVTNWVSFWYVPGNPTSGLTPAQLGAKLADIALDGVLARSGEVGDGSVPDAFDRLRENIDRLENLVTRES